PPDDITVERLVLPERPGQRRVDEGGADRIHPYLVRRQVDRHRLGEALDAVLAHAIDGTARAPDMSHLRGDMDDGATLARRRHAPRHGLGDEEGSALV